MIWRVKLLHHQVGSRFCKGWKGLGVVGKLLVKKKKSGGGGGGGGGGEWGGCRLGPVEVATWI